MTDSEHLDWFHREFWRTLHGPGIASLSRLQRDALCVMNFQAERNNGGMHQYLLNSSGDLAHETPEIFQRMGADEAAHVLEEANSFFAPADRQWIEN